MSQDEKQAINSGFDEAERIAKGERPPFTQPFKEFFTENPPAANYAWGRHTHAIAEELQRASDSIARGESYYVIISVPPRHGKSDLCSRRFPVWHMLRNPDHEVILATYGADLSEELSSDARNCFAEVGPRQGLHFAPDRNAKANWGIEGHKGKLNAVGLGGAITGKGANILIIDDYCKNRQEAESEEIRKKVWDSFRNDCFTRLAPVHAVIILATRWHEDDLIGSILEEMKKSAEYPQYKQLIFSAENKEGTWLFPERFSPKWYRAMKLSLGAYAWNCLFLCNPQPRNGAMLRADLVKIVKLSEVPLGLKWTRGWDLASTEKERIKDDPDYSVGTLAAFDGQRLWVKDVVRGQWTAPQRDQAILDTAVRDGRTVKVRVEAVGGYKDTYVRMMKALSGKAIVRPARPRESKVARASLFEALFEHGFVNIVAAPWNDDWIKEFNKFPKAPHDDQVDSLGLASADDVDVLGRMKVG